MTTTHADGIGSDGFPCSPAYLCPDCIIELLATVSEQLGELESDR